MKTAAAAVESKAIYAEGIIYFANPVTKAIAFYFQFGLEPGLEFEVQVTSDAVNYKALHRISTVGNTEEVYFSYNVSSAAGPWPRVVLLQ